MLFNILAIFLGIYILTIPFIVLMAVKYGVKVATKPEKVVEEPVFTMPKPRKTPKESEEMRRAADILANIDNYDGTSNGQKEIK